MVLGSSVCIKNSGGEIHGTIDGKEFRADFLVNAAGVHADRLARSVEVGLKFVSLPCMGVNRV